MRPIGGLVPRKLDAPLTHTILVRSSTSSARWARSSSPVSGSKRTTRHSTVRPNRGSTSWQRANHGTKLELCSISVVTTLSPSRNSVSSEYMTALMASVVFR
jgi:hypothetical protein